MCLVVAAGPSATRAAVEQAAGQARILVVNDSWRLAPWADALYASDLNWWMANTGAAGFAGLKFTNNALATRRFAGVHRIEIARDRNEIVLAPGVIGNGANSGFQAVNAAVQFGAPRLALLGFDYRIGDDGEVHWHGRHTKKGLSNPTPDKLAIWAKTLDAQAPVLERLGVEVVDTTPSGALRAFRRSSIEEWLVGGKVG